MLTYVLFCHILHVTTKLRNGGKIYDNYFAAVTKFASIIYSVIICNEFPLPVLENRSVLALGENTNADVVIFVI